MSNACAALHFGFFSLVLFEYCTSKHSKLHIQAQDLLLTLQNRSDSHGIQGFLSDMECDYLISMARGKIESSLVVSDGTRNSSQYNIDESFKVYLADSKDTIVSKIEDRISIQSFLPKDYGESMQIWKCGMNRSEYKNYEPQSGSVIDRLVTIFIFLISSEVAKLSSQDPS